MYDKKEKATISNRAITFSRNSYPKKTREKAVQTYGYEKVAPRIVYKAGVKKEVNKIENAPLLRQILPKHYQLTFIL